MEWCFSSSFNQTWYTYEKIVFALTSTPAEINSLTVSGLHFSRAMSNGDGPLLFNKPNYYSLNLYILAP